MNRKLFEVVIGVGLLLILLTFNPFASPGIYFDSTSAFTFMALHKVALLAVLNIVLLSLWLVKTIKTKELSITSSRLLLPIFLFFGSSLLSLIFSVNRTNSLFGYSATYANSFFETGMLFIFFFTVVNNIRGIDSVQNIVRYLNGGIAIAVLWTLFRYAGTWSVSSLFVRDYFNTVFFTPTGHYSSLAILTLVATVLGAGLVVASILENRSKNLLILDSLTLLIVTTGFFNFINISGRTKPVFYLLAAVFAFGALGYLLFTNRRLKTTLVPVGSLLLLGLFLGFGSHFLITRNKLQPQSYPSMPMNVSWNISLDSIKSSVTKGFIGIGQGNFTYAFDRFKTDSLVPGNLTINNGAPSVPELRINHAGSYLLETLSAQGLLGLLSLIGIFALFLMTGIKKVFTEMHPFGAFTLVAFTLLGVATIVTGYDFAFLLVLWLLMAVLLIFYHDGEPQKNLSISLSGRAFDGKNNLNYVLPLLLIVLAGIVAVNAYKLTSANVSMFWAKRFQSLGNLDQYQKSSLEAVNKYPKSDTFVRELVNANGAILINNLDKLQQQVNADPESKEKQEVIDQATSLSNFQQGILSNLLFSINQYPDEYKNYYLAGLLLSRVSEYANLAQDQSALDYFSNAITKNPYHPDTYFQLAKLFERNKNYNAAFQNIQSANTYDTNNLFYQVKYADILVQVQGYDQAQNIYKAFRDYKEKNPSNTQIQEFYKAQDIDKKILDTQKLLDEKNAKDAADKAAADAAAKPTTTPTASPTPTKR
jgi:hypothetical protein